MVIHGWPGSVWEYYKSIPLLIEPTNDVAFEVICPSIPGYGFSEAPHQPGFDVSQTARIFVKLMERLNHRRFFVHGGDWGFAISQAMAKIYPENIRGVHVSMSGVLNMRGIQWFKFLVGMYAPGLVFDNPKADYAKHYPFLDKLSWSIREAGYMHLQATKPDTVGAALVDSPVGLAAYILEKFSTWTDPDNVGKADGGLTQKFTLDELLTNIMIYWTSNNVASSMRFYKEGFVNFIVDQRPVSESVPAAVADFPNEIARGSRAINAHQYRNLVQYTEMARGGHFGAFEEPRLMSDDIKSFARKVLDLEAIEKSKQKTTK
ncbi:unnamed protein product [Medioppia subpectinata]|uniref:microsomal epoxide hydrolase n=1 Tax=Medioppia subpectinata TaxID=1979941 RepID=A0A7R9Q4B5_9ACAR|nr:unnamed protein product [Medioppia subpectinata]CAG2112466.1 unnamed protein product [Medioppia subpectinata]